jgi:hypothetical protein
LAHFYPEGSSAFFKTNKNAIDTGKNWCEIWIFGFCWCELSNYTTIFLIWGNIESCLYNIKKTKTFSNPVLLLAHLTQRVRWAIAITWHPLSSSVVNFFKNLLLWKY